MRGQTYLAYPLRKKLAYHHQSTIRNKVEESKGRKRLSTTGAKVKMCVSAWIEVYLASVVRPPNIYTAQALTLHTSCAGKGERDLHGPSETSTSSIIWAPSVSLRQDHGTPGEMTNWIRQSLYFHGGHLRREWKAPLSRESAESAVSATNVMHCIPLLFFP